MLRLLLCGGAVYALSTVIIGLAAS
jgi:hypothetical protein